MDRRTFLAWLGGAGAALMLPKSSMAAISLDDERPLMEYKPWAVAVRGTKYVIPVTIEARDGDICKALRQCDRLIDRPVFGFKPGSLLFTELAIGVTGIATGILIVDSDTEHPHAWQVIETEPPHAIRVFEIYAKVPCSHLRFVPRAFTKDESRRLREAHLAEMEEHNQQMAEFDKGIGLLT